MPWNARKLEPLERENAALKTTIVVLRHELTTKQGYAAKLELVVRQRSNRIDQLTGTIDQLRAANQEAKLPKRSNKENTMIGLC
jgi:hypothetical protein